MLKILISVVTLLAGASDEEAIKRMEETNRAAAKTMTEQLVAVAEQRGLVLRPEHVAYFTQGESLLVHGAPVGADKHSEAEFAEGVNVAVLYVGGTEGKVVPRGFYVVRAILPIGAEEGRAQFLDAAGEVVATSRLFVRTREQEDAFFPPPEGPDPVAIPDINSTHVPRRYVDCYFSETKTLIFHF